ncbi:hypothetical protein [Aliikangiella coralliicola]|uniref:Uncharacterized protein n=1 Tax=Aliikangiella coralliicola TaxID=2592383 RepID=A0A545UDB2_9GAMM|nr:hypothetical protein [Aliikangiella coralliicola]TQV87445.1 hypothetical protein FLL46_13460 [Aliikangiella coralliicola]
MSLNKNGIKVEYSQKREWSEFLDNIKRIDNLDDMDFDKLRAFFDDNSDMSREYIQSWNVGPLLEMWLSEFPDVDSFQNITKNYELKDESIKLAASQNVFLGNIPSTDKEHSGATCFNGLDQLLYLALFPQGIKVDKENFKKKSKYYEELRAKFSWVSMGLYLYLEDDNPYSPFVLMIDDWRELVTSAYTSNEYFDAIAYLVYSLVKDPKSLSEQKLGVCLRLKEIIEGDSFPKAAKDRAKEMREQID